MSRHRYPTPSRPHQSSLWHLLPRRRSVNQRQPRRLLENADEDPRCHRSPARSPSPPTTWTDDEKRMLRTLKSDEKSRFSWRVVAGKLGKPEQDVRAMWNKIKNQLDDLAFWTFSSIVVPLAEKKCSSSVDEQYSLPSGSTFCATLISSPVCSHFGFNFLSSFDFHVCRSVPILIVTVCSAPWLRT